MARLRGVCVGAGYFSRFHVDGWSRIPEVEIQAVCDLDLQRARRAAGVLGDAAVYDNYERMLDEVRPDFVDIITRPETHLQLCQAAATRGIHIICQKPLAPTLDEARQIARLASEAGVRCMVHENFRFQPWYRAIKRLLQSAAVGRQIHSIAFRCRPGDGWGADAYLDRQPYFRTMPRLLIYETGIHFIDVFRFLAGEIERVYCALRKLNPVIRGEDAGVLLFEFTSGALGLWDANRYNESPGDDPRYTFGQLWLDTDGGSIRLAMDGRLTVQPLGQPEQEQAYRHERRGFGGDCVYATQCHFVDAMLTGRPFETDVREYLKNLAVQEAFYQSHEQRRPIEVATIQL